MFKNYFNLRNVVAIAISLAAVTMFSSCDPDEPNPTPTPPNPPVEIPTDAVELKSPITENTTLKDLGLPIDYVYNNGYLLEVTNNAILTIEPGVTIQFTNNNGGIGIADGAQITAVGTAEKRIQFVGVGTTKGSWSYIDINTNTDNQFAYCDFINGGYGDNGTVRSFVGEKQFGMMHSRISGSASKGLVIYETTRITAFNNNVIEKCDDVPVYVRGPLKQIEKFDMTSIFLDNAKQYIEVQPVLYQPKEDASISQTGVPYYFTGGCVLEATLSVNEGVTIYMADDITIEGATGRLQINGTPEKKVKFTRLPGTSQYWNSVRFRLPGSVINNCIFEYGGKSNDGGIIDIEESADLTLNNVEINNSYNYGARVDTWESRYRLTHSNVTFANNYKGSVYDFRNELVLPTFP